jgi:MFS family permease
MIEAFRGARFRRFALAKFLSLVGQNSIIYAIFILVIERQDSSIATSLYLVANVVPSVLLSVPGGFVGDVLPRKVVIGGASALRVATIAALMVQGLGLGTVLVLTLVQSAVWQFYTPGENTALPAVVGREQIAGANASLQVVSIAAQLTGAGFLAPIGLKVAGANFVFAVCAGLIVVATLIFLSIPHLTPATQERRASRNVFAGLRILRSDPLALQAAIILALVSSALLIVIVAVPQFMQDTLRTSAGNAVYIFSPAAGGFAIGLLLAPGLVRLTGSRAVSMLGYICFAACLVSLGAVDHLTDFWAETANIPLEAIEERLRISRTVASTLLAVPLGGLGLAFVNVGARTLLYERAPEGSVGQLLAAQSALGSLVAIAPTLLAGLVIDRLQIDAVFFALSGVLVVLGLAQTVRLPGRAEPRAAPA